MLNLFKKKIKETDYRVYSPIRGQVVELDKVPDPVFAQKMLGDGVAIKPSEGVVYSPVNGQVVQVFDTKHAMGIKGETGIELLIHVGLETVALGGEGFTVFAKAGETVKVGQKLMEFDIETIKTKAKSMITPIVITNFAQENYKMEKYYGEAKESDFVIMEVKK